MLTLPVGNVQIIAGGLGTIPAGGSASVIAQVTPAGLGPGVYTGTFLVTIPGTNPLQVVSQTALTVYVGGAVLTTLSPGGYTSSSGGTSGGTMNISVPTGLGAAFLSQPPNIVVAALTATSVNPISISGPALAAGAFSNLPAGITACTPGNSTALNTVQPGCAIAIQPTFAGTCSSYAPSPQNSNQNTCSYKVSVDTTLLPAGAYTGVVNFTGGGATLPVNINVNVSALPSLAVFQQIPLPVNLSSQLNQFTNVPVTALSFTGTAGVNLTQCQNVVVGVTGNTVSNVTLSSVSPWLGFGFSGNVNNTVPTFNAGFTIGTISAPNTVGVMVCVNAVGQPARPGVLTGSVLINGGGVSTVVVPVTFSLSSGSGNPGNFQQIGVFRGTTSGLGLFALDQNETYNYAANDKFRYFGLNNDKPVAGDWFGTGTVSLGVFRCPTVGVCQWYIDANNNGTWDGIAGGDAIWNFGLPGDMPIVGDWNGDGKSKIGVMRCPASGVCTWYLDAGNQHGLAYSGVLTPQFGLAGDVPVANNWSGGGPVDEIGVFRCPPASAPGVCTWFVDSNGDFAPIAETQYSYGVTGDIPIVGNWFGTGRKRIGVFRGGQIILNQTGTNTFVLGIDFGSTGLASFGLPGDLPVVGFWTLP
jgi:hypothetical protein